MKKETKILFLLLRSAVFGEKLDEQTKAAASESAELLYKMARHHDLAHLVEYAFKTNGINAVDEAVAYELLKSQVMSVMRYEDLNLAVTSISELFENEKIPFIPLKGAVIRNFYPQGWMRTSCDVDILVHEEDIERAEKVLVEKLGYKSKGKKDYHDISLYSETGVHLELHFNIKENMKNIDRLLEKVWDYAVPVKNGGYEHELTNEFFMFQIAAHMSYHVYGGGCSVKNFIDLYLLKNKLDFDKQKLHSMLEDCRIRTFYDACLGLCDVWFSDAEHDETTLLFEKYLLGGGVYGTIMNKLAYKRSTQSRFSYYMERIFMPYEQLIVRYPALEGKRFLVPIYQIRRWCSTLVNGRIKHSAKTFVETENLSDEKTEFVLELFKKIGLNK